MKRIVIIGSSIAGAKAIEQIRVNDQESEIIVFYPEGVLPYQRNLFPAFLQKMIKKSKLFYCDQEFFNHHRVRVIDDQPILRISLKRNKVVFENKEQLGFDVLIIADGLDVKFPDIKGTNKSGVFSLQKFLHIKELIDRLPIIESLAIEVTNLSGIQVAAALSQRDKEIFVIVPGNHILSSILDEQAASLIQKFLEEKGVRFIFDEKISEVLGDTDAKAIRLKGGKVLAAQAILFDDTSADLKIFKESPLQIINEMIRTDGAFRTNLENVFAVDTVCDVQDPFSVFGFSIEELERQGEVVAAALNGQEATFQPNIPDVRIPLEGLSIGVLGYPIERESDQIFITSDAEKNVYKKVIVDDQKIKAVILINAADEQTQYLTWMRQKADVLSLQDPIFENRVENSLAK